MNYRLKITCSLGTAGTEITEHEYLHLVTTTNKHLYERLDVVTPKVEAPAETTVETETVAEPIKDKLAEESTLEEGDADTTPKTEEPAETEEVETVVTEESGDAGGEEAPAPKDEKAKGKKK